jgi:hypothetical protein
MILAFKVSLEQEKIYIHKRQFFSTILVFFTFPFLSLFSMVLFFPFCFLSLFSVLIYILFFLFELVVGINIFWSHELTTIFY